MDPPRRPSKLTIHSTKRKECEEPFQELDYSRLLRGENQIRRFVDEFLPRQVMLPKYGVLCDFDEQGFNFRCLLRAQGLDEFIHVREPIYTHLYVEQEKIRSEVKMVNFPLNHIDFAKAFKVSYEVESTEDIFASLCKPTY